MANENKDMKKLLFDLHKERQIRKEFMPDAYQGNPYVAG